MSFLSRLRYFYAAFVPLCLFFVLHAGWPLATDHLAGVTVAPEKVGNLAVQALQLPMWMYFFHMARIRPQALRDDAAARVFERSATTVEMSSIVFWGVGVGMTLSALLSGPGNDDMFGIPHATFWLGLVILAMSLVMAITSLTPKATLRLALSADGIRYSKVKDLIRWEDIGDIRFVNRAGQRVIAVDVTAPAKYRSAKSPLMIYPAVFNADPDAMMEIFQQERTLNLL